MFELLYDMETIEPLLELKQERQKFFYDQHVKPIDLLTTGEKVGIKDHNTGIWIPATEMKQLEQPGSYKVESEGVDYHRNR